ncbi:hypothetical protein DRN98_00430 [Methanosarcinales archaeon]|nr:MAG: hypothetical protein DRN98_00430 [Methanosarcinales archaeon]
MEYGVKGHNFDHTAFRSEFENLLREPITGNVEDVLNRIKNASKILYLTDNAGEIVFDLFFIEELIEMGKEVIISPKSSPILNDATVDDVNEFADFDIQIIPTGSFVGFSPDEADPGFLEHLWNEDYLVIAKGMGNYEVISEFETELSGRLIYILRAKCAPVADSIGVNQGNLVAMLVNEGGV